jgi:hypothetical protein
MAHRYEEHIEITNSEKELAYGIDYSVNEN